MNTFTVMENVLYGTGYEMLLLGTVYAGLTILNLQGFTCEA